MQSIINFLTGNIRLEVQAAYPERLMNLCAQNDIAFWDLERVDAFTVGITMSIKSYRRLKPLLGRLDAEVRQVKKAGVPVFFWRIRKRYALFAGLLMAVIAIWVMSMYIWDIEVVGNDTVPASKILQVMDELGVSVGTFAPSIDPEQLRNEALLSLEDVEWITVNVNGSRATIIVRERVEKPDIISKDVPTAVYATKSGVIERMIVWDGTSLYETGDTVAIGEDLVSGRMESIASGTRFVHADAQIYARTWYDLSMSMPLELMEKDYSGEKSTKTTIIFGENRINLFFDSGISYSAYDKIIEESDFVLPGGIILPIKTQKKIYTEYTPVYSMLSQDQAAAVLQERLMEKLEQLLNADGEILDTSFRVEANDGVVTVYLEAECREQIAAVRPLSEDEMIAGDTESTDNGEES